MRTLTWVMAVDMLSLQLVSSLHPESETQQSEPPNPPEAARKERTRGKKTKV